MFLTGKPKEFYIDLQDNRYYNPGEIVKGDIVLDLGKPTKINHVRVSLSGVVQIGSNALTLFSRESLVGACPDDSGRPHVLEARSNRFPFKFNIPSEKAELPTSMKLSNEAGVKYVLTAVLKVPYSFSERLAPQDTREIAIVEPIDVSLPEYCVRGSVHEDRKVEGVLNPGKVHVQLGVPKLAVVRGDILPITAEIHHYKKVHQTGAIKVTLQRRTFLSGKGRSELFEDKAVRSSVLDMETNEEDDFVQQFPLKIYIPPSTAPTTGPSGRILRVEYLVHLCVDLNEVRLDEPSYLKQNVVNMSIPVMIGTTPKADISIDDDDDEEEVEEVIDESAKKNDGHSQDAEHNVHTTMTELQAAIESFSMSGERSPDESSDLDKPNVPDPIYSPPHEYTPAPDIDPPPTAAFSPAPVDYALPLPTGSYGGQAVHPQSYSHPSSMLSVHNNNNNNDGSTSNGSAASAEYPNPYGSHPSRFSTSSPSPYLANSSGVSSPSASSTNSPTMSHSNHLRMPSADDYVPKHRTPKQAHSQVELQPSFQSENNPSYSSSSTSSSPHISHHRNPSDHYLSALDSQRSGPMAMPFPMPTPHQSTFYSSNTSSLSTSPNHFATQHNLSSSPGHISYMQQPPPPLPPKPDEHLPPPRYGASPMPSPSSLPNNHSNSSLGMRPASDSHPHPPLQNSGMPMPFPMPMPAPDMGNSWMNAPQNGYSPHLHSQNPPHNTYTPAWQ
ncbi:hypothetical protein BCR43DRAFT_481777 [Syncephalastrum racemosum]|uniref:Arrestin C-terminal-like domain-containing protein n=1 Tax=Syncephalastrum racemosum TaxID=13706 RepID=A0A1X2HSL9_SYNRA|nr:hypothetical protein BCR43DRAFT_481777 [Syncephalastrum racemosum]